jgi:ATP-dependent Lon protease
MEVKMMDDTKSTVINNILALLAQDLDDDTLETLVSERAKIKAQNSPEAKAQEERAEVEQQLADAMDRRDYAKMNDLSKQLDTLDAQSAPPTDENLPEQNSQSDADRIAGEMAELMQYPSKNKKRIDELADEYDRVAAQQSRPVQDDTVISFRTGQAQILRRGE